MSRFKKMRIIPPNTLFDQALYSDVNENFKNFNSIVDGAKAIEQLAETAQNDSEYAKNTSIAANTKSAQAETTASGVRTEFHTIIREQSDSGDVGTEVWPIRINTDGEEFLTAADRLNKELGSLRLLGKQPRSLSDTIADRGINVKDFGAIGDGVADDTTAFKIAIAYAVTVRASHVFVPYGTYLISEELNVSELRDFRIKGESRREATIKMVTANTPLFKGFSFHISDLRLWADDSVSTQSGSKGVYISKEYGDNADFVTLTNMIIRGFYDSFFADVECDSLRIDGFNPVQFQHAGIWMHQEEGSSNAPTTSPYLNNIFAYSAQSYDCYIHIKGAIQPRLGSLILDGRQHPNFDKPGRGVAMEFIDVSADTTSRTRQVSLDGVHIEDFKKGVICEHNDITMKNSWVQRTQICFERSRGTANGAKTYFENVRMTPVAGGTSLKKLPAGGRGAIKAINSVFNGQIDIATNDPASFGETLDLDYSDVETNSSLLTKNSAGKALSIISSDWIEKFTRGDLATTGYFARQIRNSGTSQVLVNKAVTGDSGTVELRDEVDSKVIQRKDINGIWNATRVHEPVEVVAASKTVDLDHSVYLVSANGGSLTVDFPYIGTSRDYQIVTFKRTDTSGFTATIRRGDNQNFDSAISQFNLAPRECAVVLVRNPGILYILNRYVPNYS